MIMRRLLAVGLALAGALVLGMDAAAASAATEWIHGSELPNATTTEGQFVGEASGTYAGAWFIDVKHQPLNYSPDFITGGGFRLDTVINHWPATITGDFARESGTIKQLSGFTGCTNQRYLVSGHISNVGVNGGVGRGSFTATLTHYRANLWWRGCVVYSASVTGTVSLVF